VLNLYKLFVKQVWLLIKVTVLVIVVPEQPFILAFIAYTAVPATLPVAVNVCVTALAPLLTLAVPNTPVETTVQSYTTPATLLDSPILVGVPEQIELVTEDTEISATGFTTTVTKIGKPAQPLAEGVTVYTTEPIKTPTAVKF
jgi:hypothetical protein